MAAGMRTRGHGWPVRGGGGRVTRVMFAGPSGRVFTRAAGRLTRGRRHRRPCHQARNDDRNQPQAHELSIGESVEVQSSSPVT